MEVRSPRTLIWIAFGLVALPLVGWWLSGLFDLDEGFYGSVVVEMIRRHEWITPYFNGEPWFEKPILLYWVAKPCVMLFGVDFGSRLPSVLAAMGLYFGVFTQARRQIGLVGGLLSAMVLGTSLLMGGLGRLMMTDALFVLTLTMALMRFIVAPGARGKFEVGIWLGLSVLAKGPVGLALFVAIVGITYWRELELRPEFRTGWLWLLIACSLTIALWYVPCYLQNRDVFIQKFLIEQNINRFRGGDRAHAMPWPASWLFYPAIIFLGMFPWSLRLRDAWPWRNRTFSTPFLRYCATHAIVIFAFFFIASAKLTHYILPCLPPLAIMIGAGISREWATQTTTIDGDPSLVREMLIQPGRIAIGLCLLLNLALGAYYAGAFGNESHAALHDLARKAKGSVVTYKMGGGHSPSTGLKLSETSHPSLEAYLGRPYRGVDDIADLWKPDQPVNSIITRADRLTDADQKICREHGLVLILQESKSVFQLWTVSAAPNPSVR